MRIGRFHATWWGLGRVTIKAGKCITHRRTHDFHYLVLGPIQFKAYRRTMTFRAFLSKFTSHVSTWVGIFFIIAMALLMTGYWKC